MSKIPAASLALIALLSVSAALPGCGKKKAKPVPQTNTAPTTTTKQVPPIPADQMDKVKKSFNAAAEIASRARDLRAQGLKIEAESGREAANDTLAQARKLYREAASMTEEWIEPDLGPFTQDQIDKFLGSFVAQRGKWISESGKMGKLHD